MFVTKLKMPASALFAVGTASALGIAAVGFTQEKPVASPTTTPVSPRTAAILAKLEQPVSMVFPDETPLGDVLKYIKQATANGPFDTGLPIYVDPVGLQEAVKTLESTIRLNVEDAPLRVTLARMLTQVGLEFAVKDETLIISSPNGSPGTSSRRSPCPGSSRRERRPFWRGSTCRSRCHSPMRHRWRMF